MFLYLQLQGMEEELRAAPPTYRNAMTTKLRLYRRDLGKLQRDMKTSAPGFGSSKQQAEGSHHGIYSSQNQQSVSMDWYVENPVWLRCCLIMREPRPLTYLYSCLPYWYCMDSLIMSKCNCTVNHLSLWSYCFLLMCIFLFLKTVADCSMHQHETFSVYL